MEDNIYHYDIYFFSIVIVIATLYSTYKSTKYKNSPDKIFALLGLIVIITLISEMFGWMIDKTKIPYGIELNILINLIIYAITPLNTLLLTIYFNSIIFTYTKYSKIWLILLFPLMINLIITLLTIFYNLYFYIDVTNTYHRAKLFYIMVLVSYSYIILFIIILFFNRKRIKRNDFYVFLVLSIFPIIGGILQSLYYGIALIWPMFSITYLGFHLIIQQSNINKDYLTGISNRGSLDRELENMVLLAKVKNIGFFGLMFDLDYFKKVNDVYGHSEGDELLREFSNILSKTFRRSECIARLGGDEFMVLVENYDNLDINTLLVRLNQNIQTFNETSKRLWKITYSCGVLYFNPKSSMDQQKFYQEIDKQLYKEKNRNREKNTK